MFSVPYKTLINEGFRLIARYFLDSAIERLDMDWKDRHCKVICAGSEKFSSLKTHKLNIKTTVANSEYFKLRGFPYVWCLLSSI